MASPPFLTPERFLDTGRGRAPRRVGRRLVRALAPVGGVLADGRDEVLVLDEEAVDAAAVRAPREAAEVRFARRDEVRGQRQDRRRNVVAAPEGVDRRARAAQMPVVDDDRAADREPVVPLPASTLTSR